MIEAQREIGGIGAAGLKNAYVVNGKRYGGHSKYTIYDLARELLADGVDWDEDLRIINPDNVQSISGAISDMAAMSLTENQHGFRYAQYRPFQPV